MSNISFSEGLEVFYKGTPGIIRFMTEEYITVCVARFDEKVRDVCIVVYPEQLGFITLTKESTR